MQQHMVVHRELMTVGMVFDGDYMEHIYHYYLYDSGEERELSMRGLQRFLVDRLSGFVGMNWRGVAVADAIYFKKIHEHAILEEGDLRALDRNLMEANITIHALSGRIDSEKRVDINLSLETYELAALKRYDMVVLVAGDGSYLPLVRKLHGLGIKVCVAGWDFRFTDRQGRPRQTRIAKNLIQAADYFIIVNKALESAGGEGGRPALSIFVEAEGPAHDCLCPEDRQKGTVLALKSGYGFIKPEEGVEDYYFHYTDLEGVEFAQLRRGETVCFEPGCNDHGPCAYSIRLCSVETASEGTTEGA